MQSGFSRRLVFHYGTQPLDQILRYTASVNPAAGRNGIVHEQHLAAAIGQIGGTNHAAALHTTELHGLEIGHQQDFLADQIFGRIPLSDAGNNLPPGNAIEQL